MRIGVITSVMFYEHINGENLRALKGGETTSDTGLYLVSKVSGGKC